MFLIFTGLLLYLVILRIDYYSLVSNSNSSFTLCVLLGYRKKFGLTKGLTAQNIAQNAEIIEKLLDRCFVSG